MTKIVIKGKMKNDFFTEELKKYSAKKLKLAEAKEKVRLESVTWLDKVLGVFIKAKKEIKK